MRPEAGDWADEASAIEQQTLELALKTRRPVLPTSTRCYNCGEQLTNRVNYCDADCRDDHQQRAQFGTQRRFSLDRD